LNFCLFTFELFGDAQVCDASKADACTAVGNKIIISDLNC